MSDLLIPLSDKATHRVQNLIRLNIDSAEGYATAAEVIEDTTLASQFREYAAQRAANVEELKATVSYNGHEPAESGTTTGTLHRWWLELRGKIGASSVHSVLSEAERGEDTIKHAYEAAIKEVAGSPVSETLASQYRGVKSAHDSVRDLRNATK